MATIIWSLILSLLLTSAASHPKLNVPRVRLPYFDSGLAVNFTLSVDPPGCYKWTTSNTNTLSLLNLMSDLDGVDCTHSVSITPSRHSTPSHTIVTALDTQSGLTLRCDVVLDRITNLSIVTTTKQLHLEEAPSKLSVRAYGAQGNEFSTLEGVPFKWWFQDESSGVARLMSFAESDYEASCGTRELELRRMQGSSVLIEGVKTGRGVVQAKIQEGGYKHLPPAHLSITVVANLLLSPSEVLVLKETLLPLKLLQLKKGILTEVQLPSELYSFKVGNQTVVEYNEVESLVTALEVGESKISLHDLTTELQEHVYPTTSIQVRDPKFLSLTVNPFRNLNLVLGEEYELSVEIYDGENQRFWVGEQVSISTEFDSDYINLIRSTLNGTTHLIKPTRTGSTRINAHLRSTKSRTGSTILLDNGPRSSAEIGIFHPITINPPLTILPCSTNLKHTLQLTASGGSGNYVWSTSNQSVGAVQSGVVKSSSCGVASMTASMSLNLEVRGVGELFILPPKAMKITSSRLEGEVGSVILIPVAMYTQLPDGTTSCFTDCRMVQLRVEVQNQDFRQEGDPRSVNGSTACTHIPIVGSVLGESLVTIHYQDGSLEFEESTTVSTFDPLEVIDPPSKLTVLALGSSRQVVFGGGPRTSLGESYSREVLVENRTVARCTQLKPTSVDASDMYVYLLECKEIGETNVTLLVERRGDNPLSRSTSLKLLCPHPAAIHFQLENTKCPTTIPNYETTQLLVQVRDDNRNLFDNITSLLISWEASTSLLSFKDESQVLTSGLDRGWVSVGASWQTVIPRGEGGLTLVRGSVRGYQQQKRMELYEISHTLELNTVGDVVVDREEVVMFNHPSHQVSIHLREGSGHYAINSSSTIASFHYYEANKTILITPRSEGDARISIRDLCLTRGPAAEIKIRVNGVGTLQLNTLTKLELGSSSNATIRVLGSGGSFLPQTDLRLIKLVLNYNQDVLLIQQQESHSELLFNITGISLGTTNVVFETESIGSLTRSVSKSITVFPPLAINPSDLSLIVGSVYQLITEGGPQHADTTTNYTVDSPQIVASLLGHSTGLLKGIIIGSTSVTAKSVDRHSSTIYSEKRASVDVIKVERVKIHRPTTRILAGHQMPLWAQVGDETLIGPDVLIGDKLLAIKWESSNDKSGGLVSELYSNQRADQLRVKFNAIKPGRVSIKLVVEYNGEVYLDEVEVEVLEQLILNSNKAILQQILMSPNSEYAIKTNQDPHNVFYTIESSYEQSCLETNCKNGVRIASVDSTGLIRSYEWSGEVVVLLLVRDQIGGLVKRGRVVVEVTPPHYIMATVRSQLVIPTLIPIGLTFQVSVSHHDDVGRIFDSVNSQQLLIRPSRYDLTRIEGSLDVFTIHTSGEGAVGVRITTAGGIDYITMEMAHEIHPNLARATVGDLICFTCGIKSATLNKSGYWTSTNPEVLQINSQTGLASCIKAGRGSVEYNLGNGVVISSRKMEVDQLEGIKFTPTDNQLHITNGDPSASYNYRLALGKSLVRVGTCGVDVQELEPPFTCELVHETSSNQPTQLTLRVDELFETGARFDSAEGEHFFSCSIHPKPVHNSASSNSTLLLKAKLRGKNSLEALLKLVFYPAIHIHTTELVFTNRETACKLVVSGVQEVLDEVELLPSNPTYLARDGVFVTTPSTIPMGGHDIKSDGQTRTFSIRLLDPYWTSDRLDQSLSLSLSSPLTRQKVEIPVRVKLVNFKSISEASSRSVLEFLTSTWSQISYAVLIVLTTLFFMHMVGKHMITTTGGGADPDSSVFVSRTPVSSHSPPTLLHHKRGYSPNASPNSSSSCAGGSGDTGYSSRRLYSTSDGGGFTYGRKS